MADIIFSSAAKRQETPEAASDGEPIWDVIELLFFAYRDFVGDPDHVAQALMALSGAGLSGIAVSLVNFADELPYLRAEVLPRLERAGLRLPA